MLSTFKVQGRNIYLWTLKKPITEWLKAERIGKTRVTARLDGANIEFQHGLDMMLFQMEWF